MCNIKRCTWHIWWQKAPVTRTDSVRRPEAWIWMQKKKKIWKYTKNWKKGYHKAKKRSKIILEMKFWGIRSTLTKNHKNKKIGQPENYTGRIRSNLNLEVILEIKNPKNVKSRKTAKLFLAIFGKIFGHKRLKLHRIFSHYDLKFCFYIKIFVRGCLNNNRKMSTNITRRTTRTSQSSPRPIFEARLFKRQSKKRLAGVSSLTIFFTSLSSRLSMPNPSQTAWILRHWWRHLPELHLPDELCTTWRAPSLPWHVPLQRKNDHRCAHLKMCFAHDRFCWSLKTVFFAFVAIDLHQRLFLTMCKRLLSLIYRTHRQAAGGRSERQIPG